MEGSKKFELQDIAARALKASSDHDETQIYAGRGVVVKETKGMSKPTEELIALRTCVQRILTHHRTIKDKRQQSCISIKRLDHLPLFWFHLIYCPEIKQRLCRKPRQEIRKVLFRIIELHKVQDQYCIYTRHTSIHSRMAHPHEPNEPISTKKIGNWTSKINVIVCYG